MSERKRIYLAGPVTKGDLAHNLNRATEALIALAKAGFAPMCPQWSCYAKPVKMIGEGMVGCHATIEGNDSMTHADWMCVDMPWVEVSDGVLRLPGESRGADAETAHASARKIPVFSSVQDVINYFAGAR